MYWTDGGAKRRYSLARSAGTTVYTTQPQREAPVLPGAKRRYDSDQRYHLPEGPVSSWGTPGSVRNRVRTAPLVIDCVSWSCVEALNLSPGLDAST